MPKTSGGIVMYRVCDGRLEVLLVHPGGPFWKNKDAGAWSIPKGELNPDEEPLATAKREFAEELGSPVEGNFIPLTAIKQKGGKIVQAWAVEGDLDTTAAAGKSNTITIEWPPRSGISLEVLEVDRAEFFDLATAREKINPGQVALIDELEKLVALAD